MKFSSWLSILFIVGMLFVGGYFYFDEYLPLKKAFAELQEENLKLVKLANPKHTDVGTRKDRIVIYTDTIFRPGTAELTEKGKRYLDYIVEDLKRKSFMEIRVESYTDSTPVKTNRDKFPTNWELAAHRATAVVRYFIEKGIPKDKLSAVSYGDTRPIASNSTPEGRKQNRRIEIVIIR